MGVGVSVEGPPSLAYCTFLTIRSGVAARVAFARLQGPLAGAPVR